MSPIAKYTTAPVWITREGVSAEKYNRFPAPTVPESNKPTWVIVPQSSVLSGKAISIKFDRELEAELPQEVLLFAIVTLA